MNYTKNWTYRGYTPVTHLPGLLGELATDLGASGIDPAIIESQIIAFTSLLAQGVADVAWPNGQCIPVGANVLLSAVSGGGKSVVFKILSEPITRTLSESIAEEFPLVRPAFFHEDVSRAAMIAGLSDWPVAGLFTDEAGQLEEFLSKSAPTLAKLLDGTDMHHARMPQGRVALTGHRFCMCLMVQPAIFDVVKERIGARKGGVGTINRFLVRCAKSVPFGTSLHRVGLTEMVMHRYTEKAQQLLKRTVQHVTEKLKRPVLRLSPESAQFFMGLSDQVHHMVSLDSRAAEIGEYASRHSERVLRLSGAIHAFVSGTDTEIQLSTVQAADRLCRNSIDAYAELMYVPPKQTQAERDAQVVHQALLQTVASTGRRSFQLAVLRSQAPNLGLPPHRFNRAVPVLAGNGFVTVYQNGRIDCLQVNSPENRLFY